MKEAFELIRKKDVLDIIHSHSCNTARIEEGVLNLPVISVFARNDKIKERINDVIERISCGAEKFDYERGSVDAYRNALSIVYEVEAECGNGWIPVEKALPEDDAEAFVYQTVNISLKDGRVVSGCYRNHDNEWYGDISDGTYENITDKVLAWMPLPSPYKPET